MSRKINLINTNLTIYIIIASLLLGVIITVYLNQQKQQGETRANIDQDKSIDITDYNDNLLKKVGEDTYQLNSNTVRIRIKTP
ncbi:hypothetical protein LBMAG33_7310 [Candidatus Levyibacteriota bacterium]|nr:hypothetical protein [Candidatus Levybacteria bacterium]GDX62421.1 hypothetical protein LBMAG33_7310 [Candidatus Levybacteria bacterium]